VSTVNLDLFVLWQRDRFVTSLSNPATPALPAIVAGDTWNISIYFVDDTSPMRIHRFIADVSARIRAQGNNHGYADTAPAATEIAPASTPPVVAQVQQGTGISAGVEEVQTITFPSARASGTFTIFFDQSGWPGWGPIGSTAPIPATATAAEIAAIINACAFTNNGSTVGRQNVVVTTPSATVIQINHTNCGDKPLCRVNVSDLQYKFGWNVSLAFTAADFTDYLLPANGPTFFEVMLNGNQAAFIQLTADPGSSSNAPAFTNGPPPNSGSLGSFYDFAYSASGFPAPAFSLTSGSLPSGLTLTADGRLSGAPSSPGTFAGVVTATNSAGSATQAFSITIGGSGGGVPGPGTVGRLASYRDGNFYVLDYSDGPYIEDRDDEWPGLKIWHIPYCIDVDNYFATLPAIGSVESPFGYFWKDTTFKYIGDGIIEFERLRHNMPGDANRKISVSKNYQVGDFDVQAGHVIDQAVIGFSREIKVNCNYHYALDDPGDLPVIAFIQEIPFLRSQAMWDFGTGFPTGSFGGVSGLYTNNYAPSNLPGSSIVPVLGRLVCRKILTG
jgi:hypothetical protein